MKISQDSIPQIGPLICKATADGFYMVMLALVLLNVLHPNLHPVFIFALPLIARLNVERIFWTRTFLPILELTEGIKSDWHQCIPKVLAERNSGRALGGFLLDFVNDIWLMYLAFKTGASPCYIALIYSSVTVFAPLPQWLYTKWVVPVHYLWLSLAWSGLAAWILIEVSGTWGHSGNPSFLGLGSWTSAEVAYLVIGLKCLLAGIPYVGKHILAERIQSEALEMRAA